MRVAVLLAVMAAVAVAAPAADARAKWEPGRYEGTTSQQLPIVFRIKAHTIVNIHYKLAQDCDSGSTLAWSSQPDDEIGRHGHFHQAYDMEADGPGASSHAAELFQGRVKHRTAKGELSESSGSDSGGDNGDHVRGCESGTVTFTAHRVRR
jgi:hypothetical protein